MEIPGKSLRYALSVHPPNNGDNRSAASTAPAPAKPKADTVALSSTIEGAREAMRTLDRLPDVREDKVAAMKRRIASGDYRVSGETVAAQLIEETLQNNDILNRIDEGHE